MHNSGLSPSVVKTELDLVFDQTFSLDVQPGIADATSGAVFMQDSVDRAAVITEQFQGSGYFEETAEQEDYKSGTPRVGNQKTFSVTKFSKSIDISEDLFDDDQHSTVSKLVKNMARNARMTRDKQAFKQYNLGFTTALTNDGVAIFSDSHTTLSGGTVDNLVSGALTDSTLNDGFVSLQQQVTQDGVLGGHMPATLLTSTTNFKNAMIVTKSALRSNTANNDMNYYSDVFPGLQVLQSAFLDAGQGGSATAWFLLSNDHSMMRWVRKPVTTSIVDKNNQRNNNYIYKAAYREVVGAISFEGMVGSTGA